jgi:hypothetical protein
VQALAKFTNGGEGVVIADLSGITVAAQTGNGGTGPITIGASYHSFGLPTRNQAQTGAFLASLDLSPGSVSRANDQGIFMVTTTGTDVPFNYQPVIRTGQAAPGLGSAKFVKINNPVLAPYDDGMAFPATVSGPNELPSSTLWWKPPGKPVQLLARSGSRPPGLPRGAQWESFSSLAIATLRGPIFRGTLVPGYGGVTTANARGVWATDFTGSVRLLFRTGVPNAIVHGKTLQSCSLLGGSPAGTAMTRGISQEGTVAWLATFTDNTQAIISTEIP